MNKYHIRFNKSRGQPGRGSMDHVWRVFENGDVDAPDGRTMCSMAWYKKIKQT